MRNYKPRIVNKGDYIYVYPPFGFNGGSAYRYSKKTKKVEHMGLGIRNPKWRTLSRFEAAKVKKLYFKS